MGKKRRNFAALFKFESVFQTDGIERGDFGGQSFDLQGKLFHLCGISDFAVHSVEKTLGLFPDAMNTAF
jgi:hypothetical protein